MKKKWKIWTGAGIVCVLVLLAAVWYSVQYNDSRLVEPMDFGSYVFHAQDFPMIFALILIWGYAAALVATLILASLRSQDKKGAGKTTRQLNPKLGLLGILGFLGFGGFWTYHIDGSVFPFAFFLFFGFFGFYYEGKMSGTFMDERFRQNADRAKLKAANIAFTILMVSLVILCQGRLFGSLEYLLIAFIIILSLTLALWMFLTEYLLYRYDHDDQERGE